MSAVLLKDAPSQHGAREVELLIERRSARQARRVLESLAWKSKLGSRGLWRLHPFIQYWWLEGLHLDVYWHVLAAPLPSRSLRRLERVLWATAKRDRHGFLAPEPEALLVYQAVQAARPGARYHESDWNAFTASCAQVTDWDRVRKLAQHANVHNLVEKSILAAAEGTDTTPSRGPVFDGMLRWIWIAAVAVQSRTKPRMARAFLAATPRLGELTVSFRIRSTEILAGPGVFVPTPDADTFVDLVLDFIRDQPSPVVVEIGTGCGAIGLAIARARPDAEVHLTDLSRAAVWWTKRNRRALRLRNVHVGRGSLIAPLDTKLSGRVTVMVANLPYYPAQEYAPIGGVPRDTIQGEGDDGLDLQRRLGADAWTLLRPGGRLLLQMFDWQWERLRLELSQLGYTPHAHVTHGPFAIGAADRI